MQEEFIVHENTTSLPTIHVISDSVGLTAQAMARLPARQRTVLLLKYDRGLDNREIARVLDMTVSAVERTVSRAKARLREALEGLGVEV